MPERFVFIIMPFVGLVLVCGCCALSKSHTQMWRDELGKPNLQHHTSLFERGRGGGGVECVVSFLFSGTAVGPMCPGFCSRRMRGTRRREATPVKVLPKPTP